MLFKSEVLENRILTRYTHTRVYLAIFTIAKIWKQPQCPAVDEWVKRMWYPCIAEYYSAMRKGDNTHNNRDGLITTGMDSEHVVPRKRSQTKTSTA